MTKSTIQFVTPSEQLHLCNSVDLSKGLTILQAEQALQQDAAGNEVNAGSDSLEAHIAKMSIGNSSGALKRQFHDIVVAKSEKSIT